MNLSITLKEKGFLSFMSTWSMHGIFLASSNCVKRITQLYTATKAVTNFEGKIFNMTPKKKSRLCPFLFVRTLPLIIWFLHLSSSSSPWNWDLSFCSLSINFQAFGRRIQEISNSIYDKRFCGKLERREFEFLKCSLENQRAEEFPHTIKTDRWMKELWKFLEKRNWFSTLIEG